MSFDAEVSYRTMDEADYSSARNLWDLTEGMGLDEKLDSRPAIIAYLQKNPTLSFVAVSSEKIIGTVLCGTDGRRGYLMHLTVEQSFRNCGVAKKLVKHSLDALKVLGIDWAHVFVFSSNIPALDFWKSQGWHGRDDLKMLSFGL